ncbi:MAG: glycosyltransferase family 39 protein [Chitinophagaceae bacterium]
MKGIFQKNHRVFFYGLWLLLTLIQSGLTELQDDEAYYWVYSHYLDWGYFDHPPMIAVLVKMGYAIFPNELGVRLFPLLLNIFTLVIIEKLIEKKNPLLFYGIALSIAVIQVTGFIAVPDIPLLFFTALFFLCYKNFCRSASWLNTLLLGVAVAGLFYSKYHAVLIVFFTGLSNLKLLKQYKTYIAGTAALLLFAPHLWWQYQHNWESFRYHLFENNTHDYRLGFTIEYIWGQLLLPGPVAGIILLPAAFLYKPTNTTEKALRYTMIGIYLFFLFSSFRGEVEANWTVPVLVPLFILSHQFLLRRIGWQKILFRLLPLTLVPVLLARIAMIVDVVPLKLVKTRYHMWKEWPAQMKVRTKGLPVVFSNSYQRASKYWFYSGQLTHSENAYSGRMNNFDLWPIEDSLLGKPVYFLDIYDLWRFPDSLKTPIGTIGYKYDPAFLSFAKVKIEVLPDKIIAKPGDSIVLTCRFIIPPHYIRFIQANPALYDTTRVGIGNTEGWIKNQLTRFTLHQMISRQEDTLHIHPGLPPGKYFLRLGINSGYRNATLNSDRIDLLIE